MPNVSFTGLLFFIPQHALLYRLNAGLEGSNEIFLYHFASIPIYYLLLFPPIVYYMIGYINLRPKLNILFVVTQFTSIIIRLIVDIQLNNHFLTVNSLISVFIKSSILPLLKTTLLKQSKVVFDRMR